LYEELPITKFIRLAAVILYLGVLTLAIVLFDFVGQIASPHREDAHTRVSLAVELARTERLKQLRDASYRRREAKCQIATEVIARQRSLSEAIEQFRDLDRQWPDLRSQIEKHEFLWTSEDEWDGKAVLHEVHQLLAKRPDEKAEIVGRLEQELHQLLTNRKPRPTSIDPPTEQSR
jgi:hypothetical protein